MKVRGTQKVVKPIEVNVDTVYVRSNIKEVKKEEFEGWEYDENTFDLKEYIEDLTSGSDTDSMASIISMLISEMDYLKSRVDALEGSGQ